jgi:hypothetical protein
MLGKVMSAIKPKVKKEYFQGKIEHCNDENLPKFNGLVLLLENSKKIHYLPSSNDINPTLMLSQKLDEVEFVKYSRNGEPDLKGFINKTLERRLGRIIPTFQESDFGCRSLIVELKRESGHQAIHA